MIFLENQPSQVLPQYIHEHLQQNKPKPDPEIQSSQPDVVQTIQLPSPGLEQVFVTNLKLVLILRLILGM